MLGGGGPDCQLLLLKRQWYAGQTTRGTCPMTQNPYQAPLADLETIPVEASDVWVDGKHLVVRSGAVLPEICPKTNQPVFQQDIVRRQLTWCSPFVLLLALLGGALPLIIVYFVIRKQCDITYGLAPEVRRRTRNRRIVTVLVAVVLFCSLPFAAAIDSTPLIIVVVVLFFVAVISLFVGNSPLTIKKHCKGDFWIAGCSSDFLARIQP